MMRAVLDANVFISYLLAPDQSTAIRQCVESGLAGRYVIVVPEPLLDELSRKVSEKPYLAAHIAPEELRHFVAILLTVSEVVPAFDEPIPPIFRDAKDDYLLTHAKLVDADYLVSGDKDVQAMRELIDRPAIRTPAEFVQELDLDSPNGNVSDASPGLEEPEDEEV